MLAKNNKMVDAVSDMDLEDLNYLTQLERVMKSRYKSTEVQSGDLETNRSNQYLRNDIIVKLLSSIENTLRGNIGIIESRKLIGSIKARAYVVFFCLYQTQAEEKVLLSPAYMVTLIKIWISS